MPTTRAEPLGVLFLLLLSIFFLPGKLDPVVVPDPNDPCHVHPFPAPEDGPREKCDPISPLEALRAFEQQFYLGDYGASEEE